MDDHLREHDILAYIEGELDDQSARRLEATLASDPELKRFVDGARADRAHLRRWGQPGTTIAPQGLVRDAMRSAERDALVATPIIVKRGVLARIGGPRLTAAAAILLAVGVGIVLGPSLMQQPTPSQPDESTLASAENQNQAGALRERADTSLNKSARELAALDMDEHKDEGLASFADENQLAIADDATSAFDNPEQLGRRASAPSADAALHQSIDALESDGLAEATDVESRLESAMPSEPARSAPRSALIALGESEGEGPGSAEELVAIGPQGLEAPDMPLGMTIDRAWELASRNRLQVFLTSDDATALIASLIGRADLDAIVLRADASAQGRVDLVLRVDNSFESLVSILDTLQSERITTMSLRQSASATLVPVASDELFWWELPVDRWHPTSRLGLRVVVLTPRGADTQE
ncbi:MAG: anti-sigma factor family protein [Phycisphaerales bacterium JB043]